jgi:hypothetical protein
VLIFPLASSLQSKKSRSRIRNRERSKRIYRCGGQKVDSEAHITPDVEVAKTLGSKSFSFEDRVSVLYAYDEVEEMPDQCAVKEKLNVRKTINSLLGHRQ